MNMDLQNIFPILFNLDPSSYPKIENSKKFILLSRVNSLVPTYARNLTELTTRFFSRRFLQFYDRLHEATVVTAFSSRTPFREGPWTDPCHKAEFTRYATVNAAFVSVASVKRSRVYPQHVIRGNPSSSMVETAVVKTVMNLDVYLVMKFKFTTWVYSQPNSRPNSRPDFIHDQSHVQSHDQSHVLSLFESRLEFIRRVVN